MADDDSSDLSSISSLSPAPSEDDGEIELKREKGILKFFHKLPKGAMPKDAEKAASPPPRKRSPSPAHDYVLADNPDIAFIVMFRSRFSDALPKSLAHFGPQELERDVTESVPGERVEHFLCAVLGLLLNRKQDVKPGHYNRALEDAISSHKTQWARDWEDTNPLAGGKTFGAMSPTERLTLLRTLVVWTLSSSEVVKGIINQSYKQNRHEDDLNQPLSVQPWGSDSDKRRYFLIEGLDDTHFRIYRESNPAGFSRTWWSVAGSIEELNGLVDKLQTADGGPKAKKLAQKILAAVPRFEATEEKRRRREYRLMRKEQFKRPEPGFSMYEGRTRGKRIKYTYSDDEDFLSDSTNNNNRRSARNTGTHTPAEPTAAGPVTTASGRQIKAPSRMTVDASNNIVTTSPDQDGGVAPREEEEQEKAPSGRPRRSAALNHSTNGWKTSSSKSRDRGYGDSMDEDEDDDSEPDLGDDEGEEEEDHVPEANSEEDEEEEDDDFDEDEAMVDDDLEGGGGGSSRPGETKMVKLKLPATTAKQLLPNGDGSGGGGSGGALNLNSYRYDGGAKATAPKARAVVAPSSSSSSSSSPDGTPPVERSEESISVATLKQKQKKKQKQEQRVTPDAEDHHHRHQQHHHYRPPPPSTPALSTLQSSTSLAFRESPDKTQQQQQQQQQTSNLPKPVDV